MQGHHVAPGLTESREDFVGNPQLELLGFVFATAEDLGVKAGFSDEDASFGRRIVSSQVYMPVFVEYLLDVLGVGAEDATHVRPEEHRLSLMDRGVEFHAFLVLEDHSSSGFWAGVVPMEIPTNRIGGHDSPA